MLSSDLEPVAEQTDSAQAQKKNPAVLLAGQNSGHSSIAVTMDVYGHVTASLQQEATEWMQATFENIQESAGCNPVAIALSGKKGAVVKL